MLLSDCSSPFPLPLTQLQAENGASCTNLRKQITSLVHLLTEAGSTGSTSMLSRVTQLALNPPKPLAAALGKQERWDVKLHLALQCNQSPAVPSTGKEEPAHPSDNITLFILL